MTKVLFPRRADPIYSAMDRMVLWQREGRYVGDYENGNLLPFLSRILHVPFVSDVGVSSRIEEACPGIYEKLAGPHGYAFLRALMVKHNYKPTGQ